MSRSLAVLVFALSSANAGAQSEFTWLGARAAALAGAFTAVADDTTAFFWNPAAVARAPFIRAAGFGGGSFQDRGEFVERLRSGEPGQGAVLEADEAVGFSTSFTVLGLAFTRFTEPTSVLDGDIVRSRGLETWDLTASFVQSLPLDELVVGVNVRYIRGTAFAGAEAASGVPQPERNVRDMVDRAVASPGRTEHEPGVDLGVFYEPRRGFRIGVAARNLNRPAFHTEGGEELFLDRRVRAGLAAGSPRSLRVSADFDVTEHREETGSTGWRELALGVEKSWREGGLAVRCGLRAEIAGARLGRPALAAGAGLPVGPLQIEVGVASGTGRRQGAIWLNLGLRR